ncbi:Hsp33 family molecular chaperone HslO [Uliginosibacterium sp. TH139]|uniref:Hsp33 family molecular chaperone HslO n=1 Tax=Uliginosibacterium sp. TH139 TaxID=2067453 RepID=UPI000C7B361E|nr:Hsp33 family molecular chaperone HslO [Uliginosibacterium sp. TH139]PLK47557.1 molecular chaperone Hsp33 [Uliginosibacterium sp. TH139]
MTNAVTRFMLDALDIRGAVVQLGSTWQQVCVGRHYPPAVQSLLGQMCAVTAVIAANLKQAARITFQLSGHGSVSLLVIDCNERLNLRGYARHEAAPVGPAGLQELLGDGRLLMSLDMEGARQPWQSYVPVEGESIAAVFEHYLAQSEQQPALLVLFANQEQATGLFLQKLPGADLKDADGWNRIVHLASTVKAEELMELSAEEVLLRLFFEEEVRMFEARPVTHDFPPDRDKIATMLRSLGHEEIERILAEHGEVRIHDDLSNHEYIFSSEEALALFSQGRPTLH